jgi:hypothetical protein
MVAGAPATAGATIATAVAAALTATTDALVRTIAIAGAAVESRHLFADLSSTATRAG